MIRIFILLGVFLFVLLGEGCRHEEIGLYHIPLREGLKNDRQLEWRDYIDSIEYIPLETTDSCFIGDIYKIERWKDLFYIRDLEENLYLFTEKGKFLRKIGTKGRGPGEYNVLTDFSVDRTNGDIFLVAWGKVMVYDTLGRLKRSMEIDPNWQVCTFDRNGYLVFIAPVLAEMNAPFQLLNIVDRDGKIVRQIQGDTYECGFGCFNWIREQKGRVYYKEEFSDTLCYLTSDLSSRPYAVLDFGDYKFRPELFYMKQSETWSKHYRLFGVFDFERSLVFNVQRGLWDFEQNLGTYWFDKQTGEFGRFEKNPVHNGFVIGNVTYCPRAADDDRLICFVPVSALPEKERIGDRHLQQIVGNLKTDANPVLALFYMK